MDYRCHVEVTQVMRIFKLDLDGRRLVAKGRGAYNSIDRCRECNLRVHAAMTHDDVHVWPVTVSEGSRVTECRLRETHNVLSL